MNRTELAHVTGVLVAAILIRALLFKHAGVWGDWGFYVYNAELINAGQMQFVDFTARSPLLMHTFALVSEYGNQAYTFRIFVVFWWLLAALPVYAIARRISGHRAGIATLLVYLMAPFSITYGFWGNTQSMAAFLLMLGLYVLVRRESTLTYTAFGALVALAFLSRRSVIVVFGGLALYHAYQWHHDTVTIRATIARGSGTALAFLGTLMVGYFWLANGNIARTWALFDIHAVNLFLSSGRGGFPLLGTPPSPAVESATTNSVPIIHDVCQRCGLWTARTFAKTLILITPVVGILLYYCRDWVRRWFDTRELQYLTGVLVALGLYGVGIALIHGYYVRTLAVVAIALFAIVVHQSDPAPSRLLYHKHMMLLGTVLFAFMLGYLYRARLLHTYYFMDFWPAISILAGVLYKHAAEHSSKIIKIVLAVAVILAVINTSAAAYPITNLVVNDNDGGWFTVESVQEYADDIDARTDPGDEVLTANPSYVAMSDAKMVMDDSRIYYTLVSYEDYGPGRDVYEYLLPRLNNGSIQYVVNTPMVGEMLGFNDSVHSAFKSNYCKVNTTGLYEKTGATLYKYSNESC